MRNVLSESNFRQPIQLYLLSFAELWDRFSYYGIQVLLVLYVTKVFLFSDDKAYSLYGAYTALTFATPVMGGFIADRWLGFYRTVIAGAILLILGNLILIFPGLNQFYLGLALVICGIGLFKPNNVSLVGALYEHADIRREGGFAILYIAMNAGALLGPIVYGFLEAHFGWRYGFGLTVIGTGIALIILITKGRSLNKSLMTLSKKTQLGLSINQLFYLGVVITIALLTLLLNKTDIFANVLGLIGIITIITLTVIAINSEKIDRNRIIGLIIMALFNLFFFACALQTATSLTLFIEREINRTVLGWQIPTMMFLSLEPLFIVLSAPLLAKLWTWLGYRHCEPSSPLKLGFGLILAAISFSIFAITANICNIDKTLALTGIIIGNLTLGIGELCVFPVMLSAISRLAPQKMKGTFMGVLFLANAFSGYLAGLLAQFISIANSKTKGLTQQLATSNYQHAFTHIAYVTFFIGLLGILLTPFLNRLLSEKQLIHFE